MPPRPRYRKPPPRTPADETGAEPTPGPGRTLAAAAPSPPLTVSARTAAEAAHGALQDALRDLGLPAGAPTDAADDRSYAAGGADRVPDFSPEGAPGGWEDEGGPAHGSPSHGHHRRSSRVGDSREGWGGARDRVYMAAGAYARALRHEGVGLPAALVATRATVEKEAAYLPAPLHAAVQRDVVRCCLEAFYAH